MSMLKHVLALFVLVVVSLSPLYADEGYIPFFPDFLEPDGIGFRGPAENNTKACWSQNSVEEVCGYDAPRRGVISKSFGRVLATPITFEYRQNYIFKNLFFNQNFVDIDFSLSDANIRNEYGIIKNSDVDSNTFLSEFLTEEEKLILNI